MRPEVQVGMLGLGTVGRGVWSVLAGNGPLIEQRTGARILLKKVLVRDTGRDRGLSLPAGLVTALGGAAQSEPAPQYAGLVDQTLSALKGQPADKGLPTAIGLLLELERRAASHGCTCMTLEVRPSNAKAQKLYRQHGFVPRGLRPGYYTDTHEDAIIMWKDHLEDPYPNGIKPDGD